MEETKGQGEKKLTIGDIALMGVMVAVIEVCKVALNFLPNIELTSFWIIMFTLLFRWRILFVIPVFILVEGAMYGFGLWWIMYLYAWPLLRWRPMCAENRSPSGSGASCRPCSASCSASCAPFLMWQSVLRAAAFGAACTPGSHGGWRGSPLISPTA